MSFSILFRIRIRLNTWLKSQSKKNYMFGVGNWNKNWKILSINLWCHLLMLVNKFQQLQYRELGSLFSVWVSNDIYRRLHCTNARLNAHPRLLLANLIKVKCTLIEWVGNRYVKNGLRFMRIKKNVGLSPRSSPRKPSPPEFSLALLVF